MLVDLSTWLIYILPLLEFIIQHHVLCIHRVQTTYSFLYFCINVLHDSLWTVGASHDSTYPFAKTLVLCPFSHCETFKCLFVMLLICTFHINCKRISICLFSNIKQLVFGEEWHNVTELCSFSIYMTFVCLLRIYMQLLGM